MTAFIVRDITHPNALVLYILIHLFSLNLPLISIYFTFLCGKNQFLVECPALALALALYRSVVFKENKQKFQN